MNFNCYYWLMLNAQRCWVWNNNLFRHDLSSGSLVHCWTGGLICNTVDNSATSGMVLAPCTVFLSASPLFRQTAATLWLVLVERHVTHSLHKLPSFISTSAFSLVLFQNYLALSCLCLEFSTKQKNIELYLLQFISSVCFAISFSWFSEDLDSHPICFEIQVDMGLNYMQALYFQNLFYGARVWFQQ